jgi:hypothetical protein
MSLLLVAVNYHWPAKADRCSRGGSLLSRRVEHVVRTESLPVHFFDSDGWPAHSSGSQIFTKFYKLRLT